MAPTRHRRRPVRGTRTGRPGAAPAGHRRGRHHPRRGGRRGPRRSRRGRLRPRRARRAAAAAPGVHRRRPARRAAARPAHHRRAGQRARRRSGWTAATGSKPTGLRFPDDSAVRRLAQRLAVAAGRRLDDASPYVDGWLADAGVRLHAVLPPVAADGTCLSLRVLRPAAHDLAALRAPRHRRRRRRGPAARRAGRPAGLPRLRRHRDRARPRSWPRCSARSIRASGCSWSRTPRSCGRGIRTSSGWWPARPTSRAPAAWRCASWCARRCGCGPDRLVVGEVRGAEVCELLAALNTGHDGGAGTVHANSIRELPARMEALAAIGGLSRAALHSQLAAAVQVVLHMRRDRSGAAGARRGRRAGPRAGRGGAGAAGLDRGGPAGPTRGRRSASCWPIAGWRRRGDELAWPPVPPAVAVGRWPACCWRRRCLVSAAARRRAARCAPAPAGRRPRRPAAMLAPGLLGAVAGLSLLGPAGAVVGAVVAIAVRRRRARHRADAAAATVADQLADALRRMVDELRAGAAIRSSRCAGSGRRSAGRGRARAAAVAAAELGDGVSERAAPRGRAAGRLRPRARADGPAWSVAERHGIPLADLLARAQQDIRWRVRFAAARAGPAGRAAGHRGGAHRAARSRPRARAADRRRPDRGAARWAAGPGVAGGRSRAGRGRAGLVRADPARGGAAMTAPRRHGDRAGRRRSPCSAGAPRWPLTGGRPRPRPVGGPATALGPATVRVVARPGRAPAVARRRGGGQRRARWAVAGPVGGARRRRPAGLRGLAGRRAARRAVTRRRPGRRRWPSGWELLAVCLQAGLPVAARGDGRDRAAAGPVGDQLRRVVGPAGARRRPRRPRGPAPRTCRRWRRSPGRPGAPPAPARRSPRWPRAEGERLRAELLDSAQARAQRAAVLITGPLGLCFLPAFLVLGIAPVVIGLAGEALAQW